MRYLVWFSMGFAGACGIGAYLLRGQGLVVLAAVFAVLTACCLILKGKWRQLEPAYLILLGLMTGSMVFSAYDARHLSPALALDGQTVEAVFHATSYSWETDYGIAADGVIEWDANRYGTRLYLDPGWEIRPGDVVELPVKLRFTDEGGIKEPTYHRTNGILFLASQKGDPVITQGKPTLRAFCGELRHMIQSRIAAVFPEDTRGFATALLLGDTTGMTDGQLLSFRLSGLSHIVAVSGLHMSILLALVCRIAGNQRFLTLILGFPAIFLFAAAAGFTASVTRAAIMMSLMLLALAADREYDPPTALAFAVVVMLLVQPLVIASVGFQLSVTGVAGIFLYEKGIRRYLLARFGRREKSLRAKLRNGLCATLSVSISASILTTPLVACYFGTVSLVGLLANVLVVPMISLIFYGIMLSCAAGPAVGWLISWPIRYVFGVTGLLSKFPLAAVYTESDYVVLWLVFVYGLLLWIRWTKPERLFRPLLFVTAGLALALSMSWAEPMLDSYRVTALDVGQGQCILLQSRRNVFLVDCGGDSDRIAGDKAAEELLSMGISRLDGLILTHYDRDHTGGVAQLALRIDVDRLYLPRTDEKELQARVLEALPNSERIWLDSGVQISFGNCVIRIFPPENQKSGNESCAAVLFQNEKYDTLIISDRNAAQERKLLATGEIPDLEILVVGHHGSKTSTSHELLYAAKPELAFISVGADNAYGHPSEAVLYRLGVYGCRVFRTDLMGDLVFRG